MTLVEYGDVPTRQRMEAKNAAAFGLVPSASVNELGAIIEAANKAGLKVRRV